HCMWRRGRWSLDTVLFHLAVERGAANAEGMGCLTSAAVGNGQGTLDGLPFAFANRNNGRDRRMRKRRKTALSRHGGERLGSGRGVLQLGGQNFQWDGTLRGQSRNTVYAVFELTHIARPVKGDQHRHQLRTAVKLRESLQAGLGEEVFHEQRNVFFVLPQ